MVNFKVLKSGGMSTGSAQGYKRLEEEVQKEVKAGNKVVLVVSAPACEGEKRDNRVTELLRRKAKGEDTRDRIIGMYESIATPLGFHFERSILDDGLMHTQREDDILYLGEHAQAWQMNRYLTNRGMNSRWVDARDVLLTSSDFGNGKVLKVHTQCFNGDTDVFVIGGFYGRDSRGSTVILPKGGSDLTADVIAASLHAEENVNLKEEPGIRATNPTYVPHAGIIEEMTYRELRELSYGGNTILQEEAMTWCRKAKVSMRVRSLLTPEIPGTRIALERDVRKQALVGIAAKPGFVIYSIRRENDPQFFQELFDVFSVRGVSVDMIATENGLVSIAVENKELSKSTAHDLDSVLESQYKVRAKGENQALVSVVGEGITGPLTLQERIVQVLDGEVSARYGPILGGTVPSTTIYYIERFGMNSEYGIARAVMNSFAQASAPITGISTTIDSISIGTSVHATSQDIEKMCAHLEETIQPDTLSVTRNGLQRFGPQRVPSNITVAVHQEKMERAVQKLYAEFF